MLIKVAAILLCTGAICALSIPVMRLIWKTQDWLEERRFRKYQSRRFKI